jgi:guanosine-3',5'-bis(diphosphate) 3'-pyrophosphohydrolase
MQETVTEPPHHRIAESVVFAMHKHANQTRKDGRPYIVHPLRVAELLRSTGGITDTDVILAGILHDLIEDTDCEWQTIEQRFGKRVADLVSELSGDMRLPKKERRIEQIERVRTGSAEAKAVKLADRLDNLNDMVGFSDKRKREYIAESSSVLEACRGGNSALENALRESIERRATAAHP